MNQIKLMMEFHRECSITRYRSCKKNFIHVVHFLTLFIHSSRMESLALPPVSLVFRRQSGASVYSLVWTLPKRSSVDVSHRVMVLRVYIDWHYEADQSTLPMCLVEGSKEVVCEERDLRLDAPPPFSLSSLSFFLRGCWDTLSPSQASPPIPFVIGPPDAEAYEVVVTRGGEKRVRN